MTIKKSAPPKKLKQHWDESLKELERDNRLLWRKRIWSRQKRQFLMWYCTEATTSCFLKNWWSPIWSRNSLFLYISKFYEHIKKSAIAIFTESLASTWHTDTQKDQVWLHFPLTRYFLTSFLLDAFQPAQLPLLSYPAWFNHPNIIERAVVPTRPNKTYKESDKRMYTTSQLRVMLLKSFWRLCL